MLPLHITEIKINTHIIIVITCSKSLDHRLHVCIRWGHLLQNLGNGRQLDRPLSGLLGEGLDVARGEHGGQLHAHVLQLLEQGERVLLGQEDTAVGFIGDQLEALCEGGREGGSEGEGGREGRREGGRDMEGGKDRSMQLNKVVVITGCSPASLNIALSGC